MSGDRTHDRMRFPASLGRQGMRRHMGGAALVELVVIGVPIIMFLTLGMVQLIMIGHARVTLNYATLLAARQGAVHHAKVEPMQEGLAAGLAPMFGSQAAADLNRTGGAEPVTYALPSGDGYRALAAPQGKDWWHPANPIRKQARSVASQTPEGNSGAAENITKKAEALAYQDIKDFAHIAILNPTVEAFHDFARPLRMYDGEVGIPNAGLYRMSGASTRKITVRVCKPVATPTVNDLQAPLRVKVPSKEELKSALLGGVASDAWGGGQFDAGTDVSHISVSAAFRERIANMIDKANLDSPMSAIALYNKIKAQADAFVQKYKGKIPDWQIGQVQSVAASAEILAQATSGAARPSEADLREAVGPTGTPGGHYLDLGSDAVRDAWDVWTCGDAGNNQTGLRCEGGESTQDSLWGAISGAYESPTDEINYTELANKIEKISSKFAATHGTGGGGLSVEQEGFVEHVTSLFDILGEPRDLGPYRNKKVCSMETIDASAQPAVGAASGVNIQDANLLKIQVLYGYKLIVPFVGPVLVDLMQLAGYDPSHGLAPEVVQRIYDNNRMPLTATAVVRMQSPAYKNAAMLSRGSSFFIN